MKDSQPAWQLPDKEESSNVDAVIRLLSDRAPRPTKLYEFFGGLGGVTKAVMKLYPGVPIQTWDADERCYETLKAIEGVEAIWSDSLIACRPTPGSGVLMDFNLWTILRAEDQYERVMQRVFSSGAAWVQLADSALGKLHLNFKAYGLEDSSWESYRGAVKEWARSKGWVLAGSEQSHHKTVMLLFRPLATPKKPSV